LVKTFHRLIPEGFDVELEIPHWLNAIFRTPFNNFKPFTAVRILWPPGMSAVAVALD
jgi:hypothetical protein